MDRSSEKKNIFIVCGGDWGEKDISMRSARPFLDWICQEKYNLFFAVMYPDYKWRLFCGSDFLNETEGESGCFFPSEEGGYWQGKSKRSIHIIFPMIHGRFGEDGALPGMCELYNIPYVGSGILGSSACWDKAFAKNVLKAFDISSVPFILLKNPDQAISYTDACSVFKTKDLFVKPAMQGSSVGVALVSDNESYKSAVDTTFSHCRKIMIEPRIEGDEIECAVLDNFGAKAAELGQVIVPKGSFYTYKEKYGPNSRSKAVFPDHFSDRLKRKIQKIAIQCFHALECRGMARVDFFVTKKNSIMVNEINTIPGFTSISLYPRMWEKSGIPPSKLVQILIDEGLRRWHSKRFYAQKEVVK
jgi:D-alanine-D-alanine ligase